MAAAVRVSRRVDLRDIRLANIVASSPTRHGGLLNPHVTHDCSVTKNEGDVIEIVCEYKFHGVSDAAEEVIEATLKYLVSYAVAGPEPVDAADVAHFAFASGTLHSWPFARQHLFGLTAEMGYPPFTLPVHKMPPAKVSPPAPATIDTGDVVAKPEAVVDATSEAK
jgi:preprotein translocase subunit SecB